jgi:nitrogen-specific signal transduction histidine kinase
VGEGTGLGLDISWRIVVKKHRGDLRVESEPGDTRFQVRIPIEPEVAAEGASDG